MKTSVKRLYEAMFLVDSAEETEGDGAGLVARKILEKAGVDIISMKRWDQRKLAYEIAGRDRGTYILCFFHADGQKIRQIERDVQISEKILRVLILSTKGRDKEDIERAVASQPAASRKPDEVKAEGSQPVAADASPSLRRRDRSDEATHEGEAAGQKRGRKRSTGDVEEETAPADGN